MAVFKRRLIFWLIKAYIKKSGKTMTLFFLLGLVIFIGFFFAFRSFSNIIPLYRKETIGVVGAYTEENLPPIIMSKLSRGLTSVAKDGSIQPDIAASWNEMDNGKTIVFKIKPNIYFNNGKPVTSDLITYNFSDVTIERPDKQTIIFKLKDAYAPFLVTASRPVFAKGFVGIGNYQIQDIVLNSAFVQSLTLVNTKNQFDTVRFRFYPSEEALKMAFLMGDITQVQGLTNENYNNDILEKFRNANVQKKIDYSRLVTLFYNTTDGDLSDKKVRLALNYALPGSYTEGERAYLPYPPKSIYYNSLLLDDTVERNPDYNHAKLLLSASDTASGSAISIHSVTIKTFKKYHTIAKTIASAWKKLGITTKIEDVDSVPSSFQIFLGDFKVPQDPDQYALWHSSQIQINNITKYKNLRIDKLLEDGRKTTDINQRKQIYANFQKYLMADAPASFLYFPKEYEVNRK